jgi:hypothetical protein
MGLEKGLNFMLVLDIEAKQGKPAGLVRSKGTTVRGIALTAPRLGWFVCVQ